MASNHVWLSTWLPCELLYSSYLWSMGDRRIDDVITDNILLFHDVAHLFCHRSQMTSDCDKNTSETLSCACVTLFFIWPHFDIICDLLLHRHMDSICWKIKCYKSHSLVRHVISIVNVVTDLTSSFFCLWIPW